MTDDTPQNSDGYEARPEAVEAAEAAETDTLRQALESVRNKSAEYLEGWQRSRAEFANYKRRVEKEQSETYQNATARVIGRFLDVIDDFDRAMQDMPASFPDEAATRWATGVGLIQRKLQNLLEAEGVSRIEAAGQFDPQLHEAVTQEESDQHAPGEIVGVVRHGYRIGDRVIRPALVRVAR